MKKIHDIFFPIMKEIMKKKKAIGMLIFLRHSNILHFYQCNNYLIYNNT